MKEDIERVYTTPSIYTPAPDPMIYGSIPQISAAFFYAMQPGVFAFGPLLPSPSLQLKKPSSFASKLKTLLEVRKKHRIALGELIDVLPVKQKGLILLLHRLPQGLFSLTALNVSKAPLVETIQHPLLIGKWAINAMSGFSEPKTFERDRFDLYLDALEGKLLLFQGHAAN